MPTDVAIAIMSIESGEALLGTLIRSANELGFPFVGASVIHDEPDGRLRCQCIENTPSGYLDTCHDLQEARHDPVAQHCKNFGVPIVWDEATYVTRGAARKYDIQAAFGYRFGIAMAMHLPNGKHFLLGVDGDRPLPTHAGARNRLVADFTLLVLYAQASAFRIFAKAARDVYVTPTARELEVLRWTLEGKTAWEVGMLLNISERTAAIHANRATHKLGCAGKHQAAFKALQLGMI